MIVYISEAVWKGGRRINDQELIRRILRGEHQVYREFVVRYQRLIYYSILKVIGDPQEAEDLTQDTFLSAYRSLPYFRRESSFSSWLLKIAINKAVDYKRKKRPHLLKEEQSMENIPLEEDPFRDIYTKERQVEVRRLIQQLPRMYQQVVIDYYFYRLSYQEIAQKENIKVKTVESRLYRARRQLKALWEEGAKR